MARKTKTTPKSSPREQLIDAAMALAADEGWRHLTMAAIAAKAGLTLPTLLKEFSSKGQILVAYFRRIDEQVLTGYSPQLDPSESPRDRLFDCLMRRFDALQPHKLALQQILCDLLRDPLSGLCQLGRLHGSMKLMLETAGIPTSGWTGHAKAKGLTAVYANALRVWLNDDSTDLASTMAALDRGLMQVEKVAQTLWPSSDKNPSD
jgi:AcrR family transcriptional regulator